jgi:FkbM family methyltransferase
MLKKIGVVLLGVLVVCSTTISLITLEKLNKINKIGRFYKGEIIAELRKIEHANSPNCFFSQYYEDYILAQIFDGDEKGTYIDVGANHPDNSSVTKYFYLRGWRGINVEPLRESYVSFIEARPLDINLNIGLSSKEGVIDFFKVKNSDGLSTCSKEVVAKAIKDGFDVEKTTIKIITFNQMLEENPMPHISFVKIDVEGMEKEVIEGIDLKKHRPSVFIIEATEPRTSIPSHEPWEPILLSNGYEFMLFDGLNRYYVSKEDRERYAHKFKKAAQYVATLSDIKPNQYLSKPLSPFYKKS